MIMELLEAVDAANFSLRANVQGIIASNNISLDSPWHEYKVLNAALKQGNKDVANELLAMSCTVNKDVKSMQPSDTPLHNAVKLRDVQLVKKLLEKDASITAIDSDANTPLHLAFILKHHEIVDVILLYIEETSSYNDVTNKEGLTHLHIACARGNAQLVSSFEYVGADINCVVSKTSQEYPGFTCLKFACDSKSLDTIKVVLSATKFFGDCSGKKKKWFRHMSSFRGWSRTMIKKDHEDQVSDKEKLLLSHFQSACFNGRVDQVEKSIANGEDVNSTMTEDALTCPLFTPLHFAVEAEKNRQKVVELLLVNGADVNLKNGFCMTPLHSALYSDPYRQAKNSDPEQDDTLKVIYEAVEDKGSNPMDPFGLTYFHVAVAVNDLETVKKFIETGQADCKPILPNLRNFNMWTPLHFAAKYGHEDMAELLIELGANVNANEDQNHFDTPLQVAIKYGQCRMVDFLLARGANARVVTYDWDRTMLHLLVERFGGYEDEESEMLRLVDTFIGCGVDVNAGDFHNYTPLHKACLKMDERFEIVEKLLKLGADINVVDKYDSVPFNGSDGTDSKIKPKIFIKLYHQVEKLKQLGLEIDVRNEEFCERIMKKKEEWQKSDDWPSIEKMCSKEELSRRQQEWTQEIEKLKNDMLNENVSLYDYLKMDAKQAADFIKNERIEKLAADEQLRGVYAAYGYLIPVVHRKSLRWIEPQQPAKEEKIQDAPDSHVVKLLPPVFRQNEIVCSSQSSDDQQLPVNISLHDAIKIGNIKWVKELLAKGVSIKSVDCEKNGPLHLAFALIREEIVDLLLLYMEENSNYTNFPNVQGLTQLHIAASRGNTSLVQKLLNAGANPSDFVHEKSPLYPGYTALQFACDSKHLETAKVLTKAMKVSGNITEEKEETFAEMMHLLRKRSIGSVLKMFCRDEKGLSDFHVACYSSGTTAEDVLPFLNMHEDVNAPMTRDSKNYPLYTALHFAVESTSDRQKKVELLLRHGADVNRKSGLGMTPLHLACYNDTKKERITDPFDKREKDDTLEILYDAVKDKEANLMDAFGLSYFHIAIARNDLMMVKKLIFRGEDVNRVVLPNVRDFPKYTPLHFAARYGRTEMAKLLIERGAAVQDDDDNPRFNTALQTAIIHGKCGVMEVLLEHGANTKVVQLKTKKTTLHLLVDRFEDTAVWNLEGKGDETAELWYFVERLVKGGANVDSKNSDWYTALHACCANLLECSEVVRSLLDVGADINIKVIRKTALEHTNDSRFNDNFDDFFMLYEHVQKLKDLGLKVDARNEKFCEELLKCRRKWGGRWGWEMVKDEYSDEMLAKKKRRRQEEIQRLKKDMLTEKLSMYDYIRMNGKKAAQFLGNERLRKIDGIAEGQSSYEIFGYLIPVVYRRSQKWLDDQEKLKKKATAVKPVVKAQGTKRKRA